MIKDFFLKNGKKEATDSEINLPKQPTYTETVIEKF